MNEQGNQPQTPKGDGAAQSPVAQVRFQLAGRSSNFDPARQAIRPDLADIAEAAHHFAPHYATPAAWHVVSEAVLLAEPHADAEHRAAMPAGAGFALLDLTGGWAWGYAVDGHIVGYLPAEAVAPGEG